MNKNMDARTKNIKANAGMAEECGRGGAGGVALSGMSTRTRASRVPNRSVQPTHCHLDVRSDGPVSNTGHPVI